MGWEGFAQADCGYHTHVNVYDKKLGRNVNPFLVSILIEDISQEKRQVRVGKLT